MKAPIMLEKPKRENSYWVTNKISHNYALLQSEILPDEQVYWVGQPDASGLKLMSMLAPILLFGGFVVIILELPFGGVMMLFGFFAIPQVFEYRTRRNTYYAVTNLRVLILTGLQGIHASSYPLRKLPCIEKHYFVQGDNAITFGIARRSYPFTDGRIFFSTNWRTTNHVGFYHLREVDEVYRLLIELQAGRDVSWFGGDNEKPKRKRHEA